MLREGVVLPVPAALNIISTMDAPIDENTKRTVQQIPLLTTRAGPRDGESWTTRLKEEYLALIQVRLAPSLRSSVRNGLRGFGCV